VAPPGTRLSEFCLVTRLTPELGGSPATPGARSKTSAELEESSPFPVLPAVPGLDDPTAGEGRRRGEELPLLGGFAPRRQTVRERSLPRLPLGNYICIRNIYFKYIYIHIHIFFSPFETAKASCKPGKAGREIAVAKHAF